MIYVVTVTWGHVSLPSPFSHLWYLPWLLISQPSYFTHAKHFSQGFHWFRLSELRSKFGTFWKTVPNCSDNRNTLTKEPILFLIWPILFLFFPILFLFFLILFLFWPILFLAPIMSIFWPILYLFLSILFLFFKILFRFLLSLFRFLPILFKFLPILFRFLPILFRILPFFMCSDYSKCLSGDPGSETCSSELSMVKNIYMDTKINLLQC